MKMQFNGRSIEVPDNDIIYYDSLGNFRKRILLEQTGDIMDLNRMIRIYLRRWLMEHLSVGLIRIIVE
jgi:hypothetical protein